MTTMVFDEMAVVADFFEESGLSWNNLEEACIDGDPNKPGSRSGFITLVKQKPPGLKATHCMVLREALASKTVYKNLHDALTVIINIINYVKGSALKSRLFGELCRDIDANHAALLFHTKGQRSYMIVHTDIINAFMAKLQLWGKQMKRRNTAFFQRSSDISDPRPAQSFEVLGLARQFYIGCQSLDTAHFSYTYAYIE
ncbi:protein FAM200C-like [Palaemon carinicauda]|uniref:protein FAM200C-like n=1 Tax=Palaemon carinicauda TaxID=392227 RepID=UPI0035B66C2B